MKIKEEGCFWQREQQLQRLRGSWRHKEMVTEKLVVSGEVWGRGAGRRVGGAGNMPCWRVWGNWDPLLGQQRAGVRLDPTVL